MTRIAENPVWNREALQSLQEEIVAGNELLAWQQGALERFISQGFPTRKHEEWKYTNVSSIAKEAYRFMSNRVTSHDLPALKVSSVYRAVVINGFLHKELSQLQELPPGVILANTREILQDKKWQAQLTTNPLYQTMFSDLNAALMTNGIFIYIPENTQLKKPLHLSFLTDTEPLTMSHPRHLIILDKNSCSEIIEEYQGTLTHYFNNVVTDIDVKENACLSHYKVQNESIHAEHIANTVIHQARDSTVTSYVISLGGKLARENLNFSLNGVGASAHLYGLYLPTTAQHIDHHTRIDHWVAHGFSEQLYKGVIGEGGHAVFNGKVIVHEKAQKTVAYQSNKNILLTKNAEIDTKPELQIYADDVKCTHGATVGQLDENALFYLRSRGISEKDARLMLTRAFAFELFSRVDSKEIQEYLLKPILAKLASLT